MRTSLYAVLLSAAALTHAQEPAPATITPAQTVKAGGEGIVTARPDQAIVTIGVTNQAPAAETAASQNARQMTTVLGALKAVVGSDGEIKTVGYSLTPNYKSARNEAPMISGYTASNTVQVKLFELSKIGQVIDAATRVGANTVGGIQYGLRDEQAVRAQALAEAARSARAGAQAIASALGLKVLRVRSAESGFSQVPRPMMMAMRAEMAAAPTPVEEGMIEVRATVTVTLDVAP